MDGKRGLLLALALALVLAFGMAAADTLQLPDELEIIEAESFYGDQSVTSAVLGNRVKEIREKAFANSGIQQINLPDSLTYIADDALPGPGQLQVTATEGTYAYGWAAARGYFMPAPTQKNPTVSVRTITISWEAVEGADTYSVFYGAENDFTKATAVTGITETSYAVTVPKYATTYYTWVRAHGAKGDSVPSDPMSALTYPSTPEMKTTQVTGNRIQLEWNAVSGADYYNVRYSTKNEYGTGFKFSHITRTNLEIIGLEFNTDYYVWLEAFNSSGGTRTKDQDVVKLTTVEDPLTPKQYDSKGNQLSSTPGYRKVVVSWEAVEGAESYNIHYGTQAGFSSAKVIQGVTGEADGSTRSYAIDKLSPGTNYYTWVTAVTGETESAPSNRKSVYTLPLPAPMNDPVVSGNSITCSWSAVTGATGYYLKYGTSNDLNQAKDKTGTIKGTSYTLTGLEYNTTYYIWVASGNSGGWLFNSTYKAATTEPKAE